MKYKQKYNTNIISQSWGSIDELSDIDPRIYRRLRLLIGFAVYFVLPMGVT